MPQLAFISGTVTLSIALVLSVSGVYHIISPTNIASVLSDIHWVPRAGNLGQLVGIIEAALGAVLTAGLVMLWIAGQGGDSVSGTLVGAAVIFLIYSCYIFFRMRKRPQRSDGPLMCACTPWRDAPIGRATFARAVFLAICSSAGAIATRFVTLDPWQYGRVIAMRVLAGVSLAALCVIVPPAVSREIR